MSYNPTKGYTSPLSSAQIRDMMEKADRDITERKRKIEEMRETMKNKTFTEAEKEKQRKIEELKSNLRGNPPNLSSQTPVESRKSHDKI